MVKTISITNTENEAIEITANDEALFIELATFDGNINKCEVNAADKAGWFYLQNVLEEIEGRTMEEIEEAGDTEEVLSNYFINHLFS